MALRYRLLLTLAAAVAVQATGPAADAQVVVSWNVADGVYSDSTNGNWDTGNVPWTEFDEIANISNGGVARISSLISTDPGQVVIGQNAGETGALNIESGGALTLTFIEGNATTAGVDVGLGGSGALNVLPGGSLTAAYLTIGGEGGSSVSLGGAASGATTLSIGLAGILGQFGTTIGGGNELRVTGPSVDFSTLSFQVNAGGTFVADITGPNHSPVKSVNAAVVGGTLRVEFNGVTPSAGDAWNLFDTPAINGQFDEIDTSAAPDLPLGQVYQFQAVSDPGSQHGVYGRLAVEQQLVLNVNRETGLASIVTGPADVDIDGYAVSSVLGGLNIGEWNSLQDQGVGDWRESPQGGQSGGLAELKPTGATTVTSGSPLPLGDVFQYPVATEFGTELEDIQFEYYTPDGQVVQGQVNYEGEKRFNNLVLIVDPDDGAAQLVNQSDVAVSIDGYKVSSSGGSLRPGDWMSLEDQATEGGAWSEANPTATDLVELRPSGATLLAGGATYNLGALFQTSGAQDLTLHYLFPGDDQFTRMGEVVYRDVVISTLTGDYNGNGVVDAADYTVWRDALNSNVAPGSGADGDGDGVVDQDDYDLWRSNYGMTAAAPSASSAAPEPAAMVLTMLAAVGGSIRRRWARG